MWCADEISNGILIKRIGTYDSYNGETIGTAYIATTGELTIGGRVDYILATPEIIPLPQSEVDKLNAMNTFDGYSNLYNTDGGYQEVEYFFNET